MNVRTIQKLQLPMKTSPKFTKLLDDRRIKHGYKQRASPGRLKTINHVGRIRSAVPTLVLYFSFLVQGILKSHLNQRIDRLVESAAISRPARSEVFLYLPQLIKYCQLIIHSEMEVLIKRERPL
ncbi:unnamed protein product [Nezara viridula]|uniref:Uncharacterized protein n=1 Tax=Nezara viridula TaxID=85310 RepID=A0A9P0H0R6_NEZVI|nr:unnamed protein product [Nezara viridula]